MIILRHNKRSLCLNQNSLSRVCSQGEFIEVTVMSDIVMDLFNLSFQQISRDNRTMKSGKTARCHRMLSEF